jgi:hypothetical protein
LASGAEGDDGEVNFERETRLCSTGRHGFCGGLPSATTVRLGAGQEGDGAVTRIEEEEGTGRPGGMASRGR